MNRIRVLRRERGYTQARLATRAGLHQTHIGQLEKGQKTLTFSVARRIAKALDVPFVDLLSDVDNPYRLSADERRLLRCFRRMDPLHRQAVLILLEPLCGETDREPGLAERLRPLV
jgi:transcriptional regulator with XRE-family HTH domain